MELLESVPSKLREEVTGISCSKKSSEFHGPMNWLECGSFIVTGQWKEDDQTINNKGTMASVRLSNLLGMLTEDSEVIDKSKRNEN